MKDFNAEAAGIETASALEAVLEVQAEPAFLTRSTRSRLIFVPTKNFLSSEIHTGIPLGQKIPCENKSATRYSRRLVRYAG